MRTAQLQAAELETLAQANTDLRRLVAAIVWLAYDRIPPGTTWRVRRRLLGLVPLRFTVDVHDVLEFLIDLVGPRPT